MKFRDHFSKQANHYAKYRPTYPAELFEWLAGQARGKDLAWDVGCGQGQATVPLKEYFDSVVGTDASKLQLRRAYLTEGVDFRCETAERSSLETDSADLITVAGALHWFNKADFFSEAKRVGKAGSVLACFAISAKLSGDEAVCRVTHNFAAKVVGAYWPKGYEHVLSKYQTIDFPFEEFEMPKFQCKANLTLDEVCGHLRTWSATQLCIDDKGEDPVTGIEADLKAAFGDREKVEIRWPIFGRVGRIS